MKKVSLLFFALFISASALFAQSDINEDVIKYQHSPLPEALDWANGQRIIGELVVPLPPPTGQIRPIAEWEPAEGVLIQYPFTTPSTNQNIPLSLVKEMAKDVKVIIIVESTSEQNSALSQLNSNGVNTDNCKFLIAPSNTKWTRDYGPWFMAIDNNEVGMFDFNYNRIKFGHGGSPRTLDNQINTHLTTYLSNDGVKPINRYASSLYLTGGNYMNDGIKQAFSTTLILNENTESQSQLEELFQAYLGIENYHFRPDPIVGIDNIQHIDCWAKLLAPDKILIDSVPPSNTTYYPKFEAAAAYFKLPTTLSSYGTPFQVFRVYAPGAGGASATTPYSNSLILNNKVFVPINSTPTANDNAALQVYKNAMPGYEIIGVPFGYWRNTDALHCRTHEIADRCMLYIKHQPYFADIENTGTLKFNTELYSYCNKTIISDSVLVYLKVNGGNYQAYKMDFSGDNKWEATITDLPDGLVEYYIFAKDESGRRESHPYIARYAPNADPHKFELKGGTPPPPEPLLVLSKKESSVFSDKLTVVEDIITVYNKGNADLTIDISDIKFDKMLTISPQVETIPEGDSLKITFSYNFNNIVKSDLIEYLGSCTLSSNDPKNQEVTISLKAVLDLVGIKDFDHSKIVIYPNPTTGQLTIKNGQLTIKNVEIFDTMGRKQLSIINCPLSIEVDVSHLPTGIYFIKIADNFYKFVKL